MWSFCSLRYSISYSHVCEVGTQEREENERGGRRAGVAQTLACSQEQWRRSRKNPRECLLSREAAYNKCWERRRYMLIHTPTHFTHCLLCSPPTLPPSCSELCARIKNLMCVYVYVCVCAMPFIPHPEHFLFRGPSHVEQSPRATPTCAIQHARSADDRRCHPNCYQVCFTLHKTKG